MKKIAKLVLEKSNGSCEVCGNVGTELHHLIGGNGKRKQHQNEYSVILLCMECHRGTNGLHGKNGRSLDIKLKQQLQDTYLRQGYDETEVRKMMGGKIY